MANKIICILVTVLHLTLRYSLFIDQRIEICPPTATPAIASILILTSLAILLMNNNIFPEKYYVASLVPVRLLLETVMVILAIEFGLCFVWCKTERNIHSIMKYLLMEEQINVYYDMGGKTFVGFIITLIAFAVFVNVCIVTESFVLIRKFAFWIYFDVIQAKFQSIWNSAEFQGCNEYWINSRKQKVKKQDNKCCSKLCSELQNINAIIDEPKLLRGGSKREKKQKLVCLFCPKE